MDIIIKLYRKSIRELVREGMKADQIFNRMQKAILTNSLHIARSLNILSDTFKFHTALTFYLFFHYFIY